MNSFSKLGVQESVVKAIGRIGWDEPTPVQAAAIPVGLTGKDLLVQAQTGTGKTGTFGSIILSRIGSGYNTPSALIITPTRELAIQVSEELTKMAFYSGHRCMAIYGGVSIDRQASELKKGTDIVVGTPGRLKDLLEKKALRISKVAVAVLDEADRMLDMGFAKDLDYILHWLPKKRQNMMFSATMPDEVKNLALNKMKDPEELLVSKDEIVLDLIDQRYVIADKDMKKDALCTIFDKERKKTIVFMKMKHRCTQLGRKMKNTGYNVDILHGDIAQARRERVITDFKDDKIDILIATDVAARGIDIEDITCVINYDMPESVDTYIHRIGRTGRAGKEGTAISFVTSGEEHLVTEFQRRVDMVIEKMAVPEDPDIKPRIKKVVDYDQISDPFGMAKFKVNLGKGDGYNRVSLADFIIRNARVRDVAIGKIDMSEDSSIVEVHRDFANRMTMDLTKCKHKGKHITVKVIEE